MIIYIFITNFSNLHGLFTENTASVGLYYVIQRAIMYVKSAIIAIWDRRLLRVKVYQQPSELWVQNAFPFLAIFIVVKLFYTRGIHYMVITFRVDFVKLFFCFVFCGVWILAWNLQDFLLLMLVKGFAIIEVLSLFAWLPLERINLKVAVFVYMLYLYSCH